ncbi:MAG: Protein-L-isoaspartate O-methyltransferase [uncultured Sphingomonas sp.]|uniref:Protein-L-isoaspartate O-methyltransferase n=1 Tax=uncultured Sphingomonas sp. TaxID=158754 RepID=A0A6J4TAZ8_9SPHN|nr:MAG: Protein-L-isoaspartate O-methyltransferase [uncultured Sphingomonas sp.]
MDLLTETKPSDTIAAAAIRLPEVDDPGFAEAFDRFADARVVLLGEASHGTSEFYRARAAITRRLVEQHGFTIVALEADWPDAAQLDRFVRHRGRRKGEELAFQRFPSWMWRNAEFDGFIRWLHEHNRPLADGAQAGLYGLDLYNLHDSMQAVIDFLEEKEPALAEEARQRYSCLAPFSRDPARYGAVAMSAGYAFCADGAVAMLRELLEQQCLGGDCDEWLDAAANARLVKNAEAYYRAMFEGADDSWNRRDTHMLETLCQLLDAKGPDAKAVVWAHNSHIGDARATGMGRTRGELNLGQLAKERFGDQARLVGFGTHSGTVAAAEDWDGPLRIKQVRPSRADSYERLCHDTGLPRFLLDLREDAPAPLEEERLERYIGVIYRPETERWSHYVESVLAEQFDGWVWFDETRAVTPLSDVHGAGEAEMWPFGV